MSPFPNHPYAERFRTYEDAIAFLEKPDWKLCIPIFIEVDTPHGKKTMINPDYRDAPFEQQIMFGKHAAVNVAFRR